jgi:hypothetical protein
MMPTSREPSAPGATAQSPRQSVLDLLSVAQGWHERAVILRCLSFEVTTLFGGNSSRYLVQRITGGVSQAGESQLATIAAELRDAAAAAQEQAERLLGAVVETVNEGAVPGLDRRFAALVYPVVIESGDLDSCVVARSEKPKPSGTHPPVMLRAPRV